MTRIAATNEQPALLTPREVAGLYRVDAKTVTRWAKAGKLTFIWTVGGHRRYPRGQFAEVLNASAGNGQAGGE